MSVQFSSMVPTKSTGEINSRNDEQGLRRGLQEAAGGMEQLLRTDTEREGHGVPLVGQDQDGQEYSMGEDRSLGGNIINRLFHHNNSIYLNDTEAPAVSHRHEEGGDALTPLGGSGTIA